MEEKKGEFKVDTEDLKNETFETAKQLKASIKDTNIKEETQVAKGFIKEMIKNPLSKIKEVATESTSKYLKTAILLIIVWVVLVFIKSTYSTIYLFGITRVFSNILSVLKDILAPICGIVIYSLIVLLINKNNKKSLTTIISTITITKLPVIFASLVTLLNIISSRISLVTAPFAKLCSIISIVLGYFGFKYLIEQEDDKSIKTFVIIQAIYYVVYIVIGLLGIYI